MVVGPTIYRSARGTKHFGYRQLDTDPAERSAPMQRSLSSVHLKRHERRTDSMGFRMHSRSSVPSHKVAPLAAGNKQEELLINFDDDCSAGPQTASTATGSQQQVSQSNAEVLSLLDSSIAEKYECLPPALGEKRHVPYDPFEISQDLKNYASQNVTPLHASSITPSQQEDNRASLHYSWSSFDSFSSQETNNGSELRSPTAAVAQNHTVDRMYASATAGHVAGDAGTNIKAGSETDLIMYANVPLQTGDGEGERRMPEYSNQHSYSYSDCNRSSNRRRRRRRDQNDQVASVGSDMNANLVTPRPVSIGNSVDWASDAISQLSVHNAQVGQSTAATSPAVGQTLVANTATWDGKSLSKSMKAAKKKMPNVGSVFYDNADVDCGDTSRMSPCRDWNSDNSAPPPVPPRDYVRNDSACLSQQSDAIYSNVGEINQSSVFSDVSSTRQMAEVHPFVQPSPDIYQNYAEFSQQSGASSRDHQPMYANLQEQLSMHQSSRASFTEATMHGEVSQFADGSDHSAVQRVRRSVPAATPDECQLALVHCYGDVESAVRHLKVEQLTWLGIAPRERCRALLQACNWNLESAGSVLLHQLSTGSSV